MALYAVRKQFDRVFVPVVAQLARVPLTANAWTLLGTLVGVASAILFYRGHLLVGMVAFAFRGTIDHIDGYVARTRHQQSTFGAVMDDVSDRWVMGLQYGGATLWLSPTYPHLLWVMVVGLTGGLVNAVIKLSVYAETRAGRDEAGKVAHPIDRVGSFGSAEFMLYLGVPLLVMIFYPEPLIGALGIWAVAVTAQLSLLERVIFCWKEYRRGAEQS